MQSPAQIKEKCCERFNAAQTDQDWTLKEGQISLNPKSLSLWNFGAISVVQS